MARKAGKNTTKKKVKRLPRYSPREQQVILDLADSLGKLLPATSQGKYSLQTIAKNSGLGKYFDPKLQNKKKQFDYFIKQVFGRHPKKFKTIVNNILAESVEKRRRNGNPILRDEIDNLKNILYSLGIDLRREIDELQLPKERPHITPPPISVVQALKNIGLHNTLLDKVLPMFENGHINEAVHKAGELFEKEVLKHSRDANVYGRNLMSKVFNKEKPEIDIKGYHQGDILNENDEREGYMYLAMGAMHWCKNIVGHGDVKQLSPQDAASRIILINHLMEVAETNIISNK